MIRLVFLAFLLILGACSSGGGSSSSKDDGGPGSNRAPLNIDVGEQHISFNVRAQESANISVSVNFVGDTVVVGTPVGQNPPNWLGVEAVSEGNGTASFRVSAFGVAPGTYTATLRFITGWFDTEEIKYEDVPVTLVVREAPGLAIATLNKIVINNSTSEDELEFNVAVTPTDPEVTWRVVASSPLLLAEKNNGGSRIDLTVDRVAALNAENGVRAEWVDVAYSYMGFETSVRLPVTVEIAFANIQAVSPRVLYRGEETKVRVRGANGARRDSNRRNSC